MMDMDSTTVNITTDAAGFIRAKGGVLMLRWTLKHGCCGRRVELVEAEIGRPRDSAAFDHLRRILDATDDSLFARPAEELAAKRSWQAEHIVILMRIDRTSFTTRTSQHATVTNPLTPS